MISPLFQAYLDQCSIDRSSSRLVSMQIAYFLMEAIEKGYLSSGQKLPGSRKLAEQFGVHRNTVTVALEELQSQGWVRMIGSSGTYVDDHTHSLIEGSSKKTSVQFTIPSELIFSSNLLSIPYESHDCSLAINDGQPDYRLSQVNELIRMYRGSTKRRQVARQLGDIYYRGTDFFDNQLLTYLHARRSILASRDQLLVGRNTELLLYILSKLFLKQGDVVVTGQLSYFTANMIFQQCGAQLSLIPVDSEGIDVEYLATHYSRGSIKLLYISPQHHYPTTSLLSERRRERLLALAEELDFYILEDDIVNDFHYSKSAVPLLSQDSFGRVMYLGSIARSLFPTFQMGFFIGPKHLVLEGRKYLSMLEPHRDFMVEQTLGDLIQSGEMSRHLNKASKEYKRRRDHLIVRLREELGDTIELSIPASGLAIWVVFRKTFSLAQLAAECRLRGLFIPRICLYQDARTTAIRMGFGQLTVEEQEEMLRIFVPCVQHFL